MRNIIGALCFKSRDLDVPTIKRNQENGILYETRFHVSYSLSYINLIVKLLSRVVMATSKKVLNFPGTKLIAKYLSNEPEKLEVNITITKKNI